MRPPLLHVWVFNPEKWRLVLTQNLSTHVYRSFIPSSQKPDTTQVSFKGWTREQAVVVCPHHGIQREQTIYANNSLGENPESENYVTEKGQLQKIAYKLRPGFRNEEHTNGLRRR